MPLSESKVREEIALAARSIFDRGLTHGSTGNISVAMEDGWLLTPTGASLGNLDPARLSKLDRDGRHIAGDAPTKESLLHLAMYQERKGARAVVHLHSTHSVALSLDPDLNPDDLLPPLTAYYVMRVGSLPLVPYFAPGDPKLAEAIRYWAGKHHAMLLAHHGPVVAGSSLAAATDAAEELEETAKIFMMLRGRKTRELSAEQVAALRSKFGAPG